MKEFNELQKMLWGTKQTSEGKAAEPLVLSKNKKIKMTQSTNNLRRICNANMERDPDKMKEMLMLLDKLEKAIINAPEK